MKLCVNLIDLDILINLLEQKSNHIKVFITDAMFYKELINITD